MTTSGDRYVVQSESIMRGAHTVYIVVDTQTGLAHFEGDFWAFTEDRARQIAGSLNHPVICDRCGKETKQGPYCRSCERDFADHVLENEWTWTGPR